MKTTATMTQNGVATTIKRTFSRETAVSIKINADSAIIWALLTNSSDFPRWNSTIISIGGDIKLGEKIKLKAKIAPKRTFKIKVKEIEVEKRMVWGDGQGNRTFTLEKTTDDKIKFSMHEKIGGAMFPLYAKQIPPFDEAFEQFASDLKKEAEIIQNAQN